MGNVTIPRLVGNYAPNMALVDPVFSGNVNDKISVALSDVGDVFKTQFCQGVPFPFRPNAVSNIVFRVFNRRSPTQVGDGVIRSYAVPVGHLMDKARLRAYERISDKAMNLLTGKLAINPNVNLRVSVSERLRQNLTGVGHKSISLPPYSSHVGNGIVGRAFDCFPNFIVIVRGSHMNLRNRFVGQGRRALVALSRPDLFSAQMHGLQAEPANYAVEFQKALVAGEWET